ncbi:ATP-dependent nuclease [Burkholderia territorii]|uniref:ATP-dependent nuclease n=1 Tax=Burkholderia territorii TaxID=1503055 RepID=UPI000AA7BF06|nr:ATP-binding protein [Burkholderia territorii]
MDSPTQVTLRRVLNRTRQFEPFVRHIRFPFFKNVELNTQIDFTFPITALVGANGANKSSILRALYGAPDGSNIGDYWFSTATDPIVDADGRRHCYIYGYRNVATRRTVEVLLQRSPFNRNGGNPDYWESSRPVLEYGMERMDDIPAGQPVPEGRSKTRWNLIRKAVVYIDFRAELSAFDKFFYHNGLRYSSIRAKKERIRVRAPHLKVAIETGVDEYHYHRLDRVVGENRALNADELAAVSHILGRRYEAINIIKHSFFDCEARTAIMRTAALNYSEAFAGSGEFAAIMLVVNVLNAAPNSLILLDEPEVSLHPGAQDRIMTFLEQQALAKKHQIVLSTHSPAIVRRLPADAIKVLVMSPTTGKATLASQSATPEEAFFHIGEPNPGRTLLVVEDRLAAEMMRQALQPHGEAIANQFDIRFFPGGADTLWGHYLPIYAAENRADVHIFLDGDQRVDPPLVDPATVPDGDHQQIEDEIRRVAGRDITFPVDGGANGGNLVQLRAAQRNFAAWVRAHVHYLPGAGNPEQFLWDNMQRDVQDDAAAGLPVKQRFEQITRREMRVAEFRPVTSDDIFATQRRRLATIPEQHQDMTALANALLAIVGRVNN